jgi:hypothetical protein
VKQLRALLDATASGSTTAGKVRAALQGPYRWSTTDLGWALGGGDSGDLVPLGHVDLLVSTVRRRLLEVRERALAAQAAEAPR